MKTEEAWTRCHGFEPSPGTHFTAGTLQLQGFWRHFPFSYIAPPADWTKPLSLAFDHPEGGGSIESQLFLNDIAHF